MPMLKAFAVFLDGRHVDTVFHPADMSPADVLADLQAHDDADTAALLTVGDLPGMTREQAEALDQLRAAGYAVSVVAPGDLYGMQAIDMEIRLDGFADDIIGEVRDAAEIAYPAAPNEFLDYDGTAADDDDA